MSAPNDPEYTVGSDGAKTLRFNRDVVADAMLHGATRRRPDPLGTLLGNVALAVGAAYAAIAFGAPDWGAFLAGMNAYGILRILDGVPRV